MKTGRPILTDGDCRRRATEALVFAVAYTCLAAVTVVGMVCTMDPYPGHIHEVLPAVFGVLILAALAAGRREQLKEMQALMQKPSAGANRSVRDQPADGTRP